MMTKPEHVKQTRLFIRQNGAKKGATGQAKYVVAVAAGWQII